MDPPPLQLFPGSNRYWPWWRTNFYHTYYKWTHSFKGSSIILYNIIVIMVLLNHVRYKRDYFSKVGTQLTWLGEAHVHKSGQHWTFILSCDVSLIHIIYTVFDVCFVIILWPLKKGNEIYEKIHAQTNLEQKMLWKMENTTTKKWNWIWALMQLQLIKRRRTWKEDPFN